MSELLDRRTACPRAPVLIEDTPTYKNLFGTIERVVDPHGRVVTNSTRIKADSLLRASGGYLRQMYAQDKPLTLSASLCFEQSYSGIDGDSASSTELFVLLCRLANLPVRQDLAVTGSVNQAGDMQAIGGVNEKIEGFYDVCRQNGLTSTQGVIIPQANVRNLMLRPDVVEAIRTGHFHIYPIAHVDQGLELLTSVPAGDAGTPGTVHGLVNARLQQLARDMAAFGDHGSHGVQKSDEVNAVSA